MWNVWFFIDVFFEDCNVGHATIHIIFNSAGTLAVSLSEKTVSCSAFYMHCVSSAGICTNMISSFLPNLFSGMRNQSGPVHSWPARRLSKGWSLLLDLEKVTIKWPTGHTYEWLCIIKNIYYTLCHEDTKLILIGHFAFTCDILVQYLHLNFGDAVLK